MLLQTSLTLTNHHALLCPPALSMSVRLFQLLQCHSRCFLSIHENLLFLLSLYLPLLAWCRVSFSQPLCLSCTLSMFISVMLTTFPVFAELNTHHIISYHIKRPFWSLILCLYQYQYHFFLERLSLNPNSEI